MYATLLRITLITCLISAHVYVCGQDKLYNVGVTGNYYGASDILVDNNGHYVLSMMRTVGHDSNVCEVTMIDENFYPLWTVGIGHLNSVNLSDVYGYPDGSFLVTNRQDPWYSNSCTFTRIDPNGQVLWQRKIPSSIGSTWTLSENGDLFISSRTSTFLYFMKVNMNGDVIWQKKVEGVSVPYATSIIETMDGNLLLTMATNLPGTDFVKIDTAGQILWSKGVQVDPLYYERFYRVSESSNGDLIMLNSMGQAINSTLGIIVRRFDSNLNYVISTGFDAPYNDTPYDVILDEQDNVYLSIGTKPVAVCGGNAMFIKMDPNLDTTWVKVYGLPQANGFGFFNFYKRNNELYCAGWGSTGSQFSIADAHFIKSDFSMDLECLLYTVNLSVITPPNLMPYSVSYTMSPTSVPWTEFSFTEQNTVQIMDACTGQILNVEEFVSTSPEKELLMVTDLMGRVTEAKANTLLIYVYSDGTTEKVFKME